MLMCRSADTNVWGTLPIFEILIYKQFEHKDVEGMYKIIGEVALFTHTLLCTPSGPNIICLLQSHTKKRQLANSFQ